MMKRVLIVGPVPQYAGGASRFVKDMLDADLGYEIVPFDTSRPLKPSRKTVIGYQGILDVGVLWAIRNVLITLSHMVLFPFHLVASRAPIVHICTSNFWVFWESTVYAIIARILGRRTILHIHTDFISFYKATGQFGRKWMARALTVMDRVIVLTESAAIVARKLTNPERISMVPTSIRKSELPEVIPCSGRSEPVTMLFMGGHHATRKGVNELAQAIPRVLEQCSCRFIIAGGKDVEKVYRALCRSGYGESVEYVGWVPEEEKSGLLGRADVYVLPSNAEGMPRGLIEAMAVGLPVISTRIGGIPDMIIEGQNGFLVDAGDVQALVESIVLLALAPDLRERMRQANINKVHSQWLQESVFQSYRHLYDELLRAD
jgi:glycosyltransferase involved in cell wall biosynthesis